MAIALRHRPQLPSDLVMLVRVVSMSEGLGAQLDLAFRLFEFATPFLPCARNLCQTGTGPEGEKDRAPAAS